MHDVDDAKRAAAQRPEDGDGGHGPQDEFEVEVIRHVGAAVGFADGHGEHGVGDHPRHHHVRAHALVVIFLLLGFADAVLFDFESIAQVSQCFVVPAVDVELFARHFQFDSVALSGDGGAKIDVDDVIAFCAPGDVVGVAEGVHLEGADVGGQEGEVLGGGGEHVPGVEIEEGHEEVETDGGSSGYDEVGEKIIAEFKAGGGCFQLEDYDVQGREGGVGHDDRVDDDAGHEHPLGSGWAGIWLVIRGVLED